jgi:hypothetical protein
VVVQFWVAPRLGETGTMFSLKREGLHAKISDWPHDDLV